MPNNESRSFDAKKGKKRRRFNVEIDASLAQQIEAEVLVHRHEGMTIRSFVEDALKQRLNPQDAIPNLLRAIGRLESHLKETRARLNVLGQAFLHFLRYWFVLWPQIPAELQKTHKEISAEMFAKYARSLMRRMNQSDIWDILDPEKFDGMIDDLDTTSEEYRPGGSVKGEA